jgi:hypothetical protein
MNTLAYQAFDRIRAEFVEMPRMQLTPEQVERLSGVDSAICKSVLDDLVRAGFLCISVNGSYGRWSDSSTPRPGGRRESMAARPGTSERRGSRASSLNRATGGKQMRRSPKAPEDAGLTGAPQLEPDAQEPPTNSREHGADRRDSIARRAYERFQMRGGEHGRDQDDWLAAEQELNGSEDE